MLKEYDVSRTGGMSSYISKFHAFLAPAVPSCHPVALPAPCCQHCAVFSPGQSGLPCCDNPLQAASPLLTQPSGCYNVATKQLLHTEGRMPFPDRIERTLELPHPPSAVWA